MYRVYEDGRWKLGAVGQYFSPSTDRTNLFAFSRQLHSQAPPSTPSHKLHSSDPVSLKAREYFDPVNVPNRHRPPGTTE